MIAFDVAERICRTPVSAVLEPGLPPLSKGRPRVRVLRTFACSVSRGKLRIRLSCLHGTCCCFPFPPTSTLHLCIRAPSVVAKGEKGEGVENDQDEFDVWVRSRPDHQEPGLFFRNASAGAAAHQFCGRNGLRGLALSRSLPSLFSCSLLSPRTTRAMRLLRTQTSAAHLRSHAAEKQPRSLSRPRLGDNPTSLDALFRHGWEAYDSCDRDVTPSRKGIINSSP